MIKLLEAADIAREIGRTPNTVRYHIGHGLLVPVAVTPRGIRLFAASDVERFKRLRRKRAAARVRAK